MSEQLRIEQVKIDQWGRASHFARILPDNGFVVLFGENESGKTSLAAVLAWLLAGPGPQQLLRRFGDDGDELAASLRGWLGAQQLEIRVTAKVPKARASGRAKESYQRFRATVGDAEQTRAQLETRLGVGDFDSYQNFYWLESLRVAEQPDLTDDLSVKVQFGDIDPYGQSKEFAEKKREALGASESNPAGGSALRLSHDRGELDKRLRQIAGAQDELSQVDDILQQKRGDRDRIESAMASLRRVVDSITGGHLDKWKDRVGDLEAASAPSPSDRALYEQQPSALEAIVRLEEAETARSRLSDDLERASTSPRSRRRTALRAIAATCTAALAVLLALFVDWRLGPAAG